MKLEIEIKELQREIEDIDDPKLIALIRNLLSYSKAKSEDRISIEQYNKEIDEAVARFEAGDFLTNDEVKEITKNW